MEAHGNATNPGSMRLRGDAVEWREVDGEIVALDLRAARYLHVNPSGAALWPELASGATTEALVAKLVERFGIEEADARKDVGSFVEMLDGRGLLERT